jgi:hypothetical protein
MPNNEPTVEIPATDVEETALQMEELEPRVAPNVVWGD